MIPRSPSSCQTENNIIAQEHAENVSIQATDHSLKNTHWKKELANANLTMDALFKKLQIPIEDQVNFLCDRQIQKNFPLRVTQSFIDRMKKGDIQDPLFLQIAPQKEELEIRPGFSDDPLQESDANPIPGLIQKYRHRALLIVAKACAIHCRYCFRRHFPYEDNAPGSEWSQALNYLANDTSINEVIYSGGDPLAASDRYLYNLTHQLSQIKHLKRLRVHTRLPVVLPSRINEDLLEWLGIWPGEKIFVIHCNHANELNKDVGDALQKLHQHKVTLLNQSVLLQGINDSVEALTELSNKLFEFGVMPYYLHRMDPVANAHHFDISREDAKKLISEVSAHLPGYLVPKLVEEVPGAPAKKIL